jgi:acylphosphatase
MTEDRQVRVRFTIAGRVQGVGFRWFTRSAAGDLGLVGWVKNQADGTVLCEAQGPAAAVDALRERLARGPRFARVRAVDEEPLVVEDDERAFDIVD